MSLEPDPVMLIMIFNACAKLANDQAKTIGKTLLQERQSSNTFLQHEKLVNTAIDMLMKFGDVSDAEDLFEQTETKSIVTYGTMMKGNPIEIRHRMIVYHLQDM